MGYKNGAARLRFFLCKAFQLKRLPLYFAPSIYDVIMKLPALITLFCLCQISSAAAEIYKRVDADGHVTYSSTPLKGATRLYLESAGKPAPAPTISGASAVNHANPVAPHPKRNEEVANFPKVDSATQKGRDYTRRKILEDELASEQRLLLDAQKKLQEAINNPETYPGQDGKPMRNAAKQEEKLTALREHVRTHEKNIDALKTELSTHRP